MADLHLKKNLKQNPDNSTDHHSFYQQHQLDTRMSGWFPQDYYISDPNLWSCSHLALFYSQGCDLYPRSVLWLEHRVEGMQQAEELGTGSQCIWTQILCRHALWFKKKKKNKKSTRPKQNKSTRKTSSCVIGEFLWGPAMI